MIPAFLVWTIVSGPCSPRTFTYDGADAERLWRKLTRINGATPKVGEVVAGCRIEQFRGLA